MIPATHPTWTGTTTGSVARVKGGSGCRSRCSRWQKKTAPTWASAISNPVAIPLDGAHLMTNRTAWRSCTWAVPVVSHTGNAIKIAYRDGMIRQVTPEFDDLECAALSGASPLSPRSNGRPRRWPRQDQRRRAGSDSRYRIDTGVGERRSLLLDRAVRHVAHTGRASGPGASSR